MMNLKRAIIVITLVLICAIYSPLVCAGTLSDEYFESVSTNLLTTKSVAFSAHTKVESESIKVTMCKLYKMVGSNWQFVAELPPPSYEATNSEVYGAVVDYSDYIGSGTYRLYVTCQTEGHSLSRYSNSRTF